MNWLDWFILVTGILAIAFFGYGMFREMREDTLEYKMFLRKHGYPMGYLWLSGGRPSVARELWKRELERRRRGSNG
jgi:hypothetical protein